VLAAEASQKFNAQSLDAEQKKLHLGASTTALVLQQSRNLATAENSLTSAARSLCQGSRQPLSVAGHNAAALRHQPG
jgi:hypothetical protein